MRIGKGVGGVLVAMVVDLSFGVACVGVNDMVS